MTTSIVPFGKYKGQPVEALQQDRGYCEWLAGQDWFRTRYANIHTLIVNHFGEPCETPEHNQMQARFLDNDWSRRFLTLRSTDRDFAAAWRRKLINDRAFCFDVLSKRRTQIAEWLATIKDRSDPYSITERERVAGYSVAMEQLVAESTIWTALFNGGILARRSWDEIDTAFEQGGIDVYIEARVVPLDATWRIPKAAPRELHPPYLEYSQTVGVFWFESKVRYAIECKPSLGDDYPAVLRNMRTINADTLIIADYAAAGATLAQVRRIFDPIVVLTTAEIEAANSAP